MAGWLVVSIQRALPQSQIRRKIANISFLLPKYSGRCHLSQICKLISVNLRRSGLRQVTHKIHTKTLFDPIEGVFYDYHHRSSPWFAWIISTTHTRCDTLVLLMLSFLFWHLHLLPCLVFIHLPFRTSITYIPFRCRCRTDTTTGDDEFELWVLFYYLFSFPFELTFALSSKHPFIPIVVVVEICQPNTHLVIIIISFAVEFWAKSIE